MGTSFSDEQFLKFSVKPRQQLKISVHPITLVRADGTLEWAPQNTPSKAALEEYLNKTFGDQANIFCTVTVTAGARVNWEHGLTASDEWGADNKVLDILSPGEGGLPNEEAAVTNAIHDSSVDVNVYFIARGIQTVSKVNGVWKARELLGFAGKGNKRTQGNLYVADYVPDGNNPHHRWVIAHEMGHYIGKLVHSTDAFTWNVSYMPGTDNTLRLMSDYPPSQERNPRMLLKAEWDKLHEFFRN